MHGGTRAFAVVGGLFEPGHLELASSPSGRTTSYQVCWRPTFFQWATATILGVERDWRGFAPGPPIIRVADYCLRDALYTVGACLGRHGHPYDVRSGPAQNGVRQALDRMIP